MVGPVTDAPDQAHSPYRPILLFPELMGGIMAARLDPCGSGRGAIVRLIPRCDAF